MSNSYREKSELGKWIPVECRLPENDDYILVSFDNFLLPDIGRYEVDKDGGAFYPGDDEKSYISHGLFVNAWMPLPRHYKPGKSYLLTNGDRIRSMTDKELAEVILCPEDKSGGLCTGKEVSAISISLCRACCIAWLRAPAQKETVPAEWEQRIMQHFEKVE